MDPNVTLESNPDGDEGDRSNSYARLLGELQFLANATRPDIAFAVNRLASYTANPSLEHVGALKRILRYLSGTKSYGITYSATPTRTRSTNLFHGYADAAFANVDKSKSTSGYVYLVGGSAITWMSKKQSVVALSSTCWLRSLYAMDHFCYVVTLHEEPTSTLVIHPVRCVSPPFLSPLGTRLQ
jgi:hypothetical protein